MPACLARNYPEALSHCGHGHDLPSVVQLSVINIADISGAFVKTLASEHFSETLSKAHRSRESRQRWASMLVYNISDVGDVQLVTTTNFQEKCIFYGLNRT